MRASLKSFKLWNSKFKRTKAIADLNIIRRWKSSIPSLVFKMSEMRAMNIRIRKQPEKKPT